MLYYPVTDQLDHTAEITEVLKENSQRPLIVSLAYDDDPCLQGLILSLRQISDTIDIAVINIGFSLQESSWLSKQGVVACVPIPLSIKWYGGALDALSYTTKIQQQPWLWCHSLLPQLFPGRPWYIWMDPTAWVQHPDGLTAYLRGRSEQDVVVATEVDRLLFMDVQYVKYLNRLRERLLTQTEIYGISAATLAHTLPLFNNTIFGAAADSKWWDILGSSTFIALHKALAGYKVLELPNFAHAIFNHALAVAITNNFIKLRALPFSFNYLTELVPPFVLPTKELLEPYAPRMPIHVLNSPPSSSFRYHDRSSE